MLYYIMIKLYKTLAVIFLLFITTGCSTVKTAIAMMQSTDDFMLYSDKNGYIFQETNSSFLAKDSENYLEKAIDLVEQMQYEKFIKPVEIYTLSTLKSVEKYCGFRLILGCVVNEKIFLSPRILTQPSGTLPRLLSHELSHLQLIQQLSMMELADIPTWFREGLAVFVSTNMKNVASINFDEAKDKKLFYPNKKGSIFLPKDNASFGLSRSIFYKQAGSFVQFLHDSDETSFKKLLLSIQKKRGFSKSFKESYSVSVDFKWSEFVESIRDRKRE